MNRLTLALMAIALSPVAMALEKPFVGIDYQQGTFELNGAEAKPEVVRIQGGSEITPYLAVEAQLGVNAATDQLKLQGVNFDIKIDSYYALFVRPQISLGDFGSLYGLAGGTYLDVTATSDNPGVAPSDAGFRSQFSYGGGLDFKIYKNIRLNADYIKYIDGYDAVSAGVRINL